MQQVETLYSVGKGAWPAASPTSVLEEDLSDFMADCSWEASPPPSVSQPSTSSPIRGSPLSRSPLQGSPLHSSSSSESAMQQLQDSRPASAEGHKTTRSLVQTLQECLTSLPQSTTSGDNNRRSLSDPTGATTSSSLQSSSRSASKRRPRASRRTPTTILETNPSDFRDMVQKLTGIPSATPTPGAAPVRPRPQRANSNGSFIRPETLHSIRRLPAMAPPPPLPTPLPPFLQHLQRRRTPEMIHSTTVKPAQSCPLPFARSCKREFDQTEDHMTSESLMKRAMSAPTTSMPSWWWEQESESRNIDVTADANPPFAMSNSSESPSAYKMDSLGMENLLPVSEAPTEYVRMDSASGQWVQEEQEFTFSELESWLATESMRG